MLPCLVCRGRIDATFFWKMRAVGMPTLSALAPRVFKKSWNWEPLKFLIVPCPSPDPKFKCVSFLRISLLCDFVMLIGVRAPTYNHLIYHVGAPLTPQGRHPWQRSSWLWTDSPSHKLCVRLMARPSCTEVAPESGQCLQENKNKCKCAYLHVFWVVCIYIYVCFDLSNPFCLCWSLRTYILI